MDTPLRADTSDNDTVTPLPSAGDAPTKTQPHNIEAEQGLLGALLVNNDALDRVSDFLTEAHFFDPVHARIYEAAAKLIGQGNLASTVTLRSYFEQDEGLNQLGGATYLAGLAGNATSLTNAAQFGRTIYELALRRQLIGVGESMIGDAQDSGVEDPPDQQIERAEQALYRIAEKGTHSGGFMSFANALTGAVNTAERAYKSDGGLSGLSTGLHEIDNLIGGLQKSDLVILAGRPGMGKTALATNIAFTIAQNYQAARDNNDVEKTADGRLRPRKGASVGFFSLEMSADQLALRLLSERSRVSSANIRKGQIQEEEFNRIAQAARELQETPLFIDQTGAIPIATLAARARRLKRQKDLGLIVVDYLQLARASNTRHDARVYEVSEITQGLKALAKELDVPVLALSQLSRKVEERDNKRPQLSDLRESGSIEQDADIVMFVFRQDYYLLKQKPDEGTDAFLAWQEQMEKASGTAEIIIDKNRHGPTGSAALSFEDRFTRFDNLAHDDEIPESRF